MLSKTALHAVRALAFLADQPDGAYAGAASIAAQIGAPQNYLGKLLQTLAREGLLISQKGMGGGFSLAMDPKDISLYEVVEPIDHVSRFSSCMLGFGKCSDENPCPTHDRWGAVRDAYLELLRDTSIASLSGLQDRTAANSLPIVKV